MRTGSPAGHLYLADIKRAWYAFLTTLIPIFLYSLLQNMDELQSIALNAIATSGILSHWQMLIVIPLVTSIFTVIVLWMRDNSKK